MLRFRPLVAEEYLDEVDLSFEGEFASYDSSHFLATPQKEGDRRRELVIKFLKPEDSFAEALGEGSFLVREFRRRLIGVWILEVVLAHWHSCSPLDSDRCRTIIGVRLVA